MKKCQKICFVVSAEQTLTAFLLNHLRVLSEVYDLTVILNTQNLNLLKEHNIPGRIIPVKITRNIRLISDIFCLIKLISIFRVNRFSAVHSVTPKAGLLAMLAAFVARVPLRIHTFTGQIWVNSPEPKRTFFKLLDRLIGYVTTCNIVDSQSQLDFLLAERVLKKEKSFVFGAGSIAGVDLDKFRADAELKGQMREELLIPENAVVFLYLGRLTIDKGVLDLAKAFSEITSPQAFLVFVGPDEAALTQQISAVCAKKLSNLRFIGFTKTPQRYMAVADVLCLPSYREGFGSVIIEAAAMGIPAIASHIYGVTDAVVDHQTGILHTPRNISEIKAAMMCLLNNPSLVICLAGRALERAKLEFDAKLISRYWLDFYISQLPSVNI